MELEFYNVIKQEKNIKAPLDGRSGRGEVFVENSGDIQDYYSTNSAQMYQ
jgi:hypothetical protein